MLPFAQPPDREGGQGTRQRRSWSDTRPSASAYTRPPNPMETGESLWTRHRPISEAIQQFRQERTTLRQFVIGSGPDSGFPCARSRAGGTSGSKGRTWSEAPSLPVYSDYSEHPREISATARNQVAPSTGYKTVTISFLLYRLRGFSTATGCATWKRADMAVGQWSHQPAAPRENRRAPGDTHEVLLVAAGRESPDATTVRRDNAHERVISMCTIGQTPRRASTTIPHVREHRVSSHAIPNRTSRI